MVLIKSELMASLQKEVRILLHLASKIDRAALDYRPTPKQRSTIELLRYLTTMGPMLVRYAKGDSMDASAMSEAVQVAEARNFEQTLAAIAAQLVILDVKAFYRFSQVLDRAPSVNPRLRILLSSGVSQRKWHIDHSVCIGHNG